METIGDDHIKAMLEAALADCSSETVRLVRPLLHLPVVQHMLHVFLMDQSRSFEDWIRDPQCQHRLWHLKERIGSHDVPAMTATYEEQLALAMQRRLRTSQSSPGVVPVGASPVPGDNISSDHAQAPEFREGGVDKDADVVDADGGGGDAHLPSTQVGSSAEEGSWPYSGGGGGAFEETEIIRPPQGQDDCEMLLVMSEATKADARRKFEKGDFMGAARTYRTAAVSLDERRPPSSASAEPLRKRLKDLYVKCMCNAAVAGFKAAAAAPSPGEAHGLVVDACTRALERSGGCCPKASFWRARVKMSQHMYEAAEADLVKAVADEESEVRSKWASVRNRGETETETEMESKTQAKTQAKDDATESHCNGDGVEVQRQGPEDVGGQTPPREVAKEPERHSKDSQDHLGGESAAGKGARCSGEVGNTSGAPGEAKSNGHSVKDTETTTETESIFHGPRLKEAEASSTTAASSPECERVPPKKSPPNGLSEAARWLARVRAKIAKVDAARALAAKQSFERDARIIAARELAGKKAREWRRHGPGHVAPRSPGEGQACPSNSGGNNAASAGEDRGGWEQDKCHGDESGDGSPAEAGSEDDASNEAGWRVPKPPLLNSPGRNPATLLNDYALHARFQAVPSYEQIKGESGRPEYLCTLAVGPGDRIVGSGQGTNLKAAKRNACVDFLTNAAVAWNEENPCDLIDMAKMVAPPQEPPKKHEIAEADVTDEFKAYVEAWVELVALDKIQEAAFPIEISRMQRKHVHDVVESRGDERLLSKSCTIKGRRRLSVMRKEMMEGLAYTSRGNVVVVDIPNVNILPSEVGDLDSITRPPPEPIVGNVNKTRTEVPAS